MVLTDIFSVDLFIVGVYKYMENEIELEIVNKYENERYTLRHLAEIYKTDHHTIKRVLVKRGVRISRRNTLKKFTKEHRKKISDSRKKLVEKGWVPHNKGKKTIDSKNGKIILYKNMLSHLRFKIELDWLIKFDDFEKLKCLNRAITKREDRFAVDTSWYILYIEKFYNDAQFNEVYQRWIGNKKDKYLLPTLDHIIPKSKGGDNDLKNLQFLSWFENRSKNNLSQIEWDEMKKNISIYLI